MSKLIASKWLLMLVLLIAGYQSLMLLGVIDSTDTTAQRFCIDVT